MNLHVCSFSGYKLYPGRGIRFIRGDSRNFVFYSKKCLTQFLAKRNPRTCAWTTMFRQQHRKGQTEVVTKKKNTKLVKAERGLAGIELEELRARRNQKPEERLAAREAAAKAIKDKIKAKNAAKIAAREEERKAAEAKKAEERKKASAASKKQVAQKAKPVAAKQKGKKVAVHGGSR